jgi:hypothetical protein
LTQLLGTHGGRGVHQQPHGDVILGLEQLERQHPQPGVEVVVDTAEIVTRVILAVIGEVDAAAVSNAAMGGGILTRQALGGVQGVALQAG